LDSCQFKTVLHANVPRVKCPQHGVKQVDVPWAEKGSRYTTLFERFAIDVLLATQTITGAMAILRTKWDQTWNILQRAVTRGQDRKEEKPLPRIGIDEKAFAKGQSYLTLLYDLDHSTVEAISDGHDTDSGVACFSQLSLEQITSVEAVAMDLSAAYVKAAKQVIPLAEHKIVHDRFHVMQLATKAVDQVRRGEHRQLTRDDDHRLAKTKYVWLKSQENLTAAQRTLLDATFTLQLRKSVGLQRDVARPVASPHRGRCQHLFPRLVSPRDPHQIGTAEESRPDHQGSARQHRQLLHPRHHQRGGRRPQQ
jgi:transposase